MQWVNGTKTTALSVTDRSIQFGDGVFRTMRKERGQILFWDDHYRKLAHDAGVLGLTCPAQSLLETELKAVDLENAAIKIILTRGSTARGYSAPDDLIGNRIITVHPLTLADPSRKTQGVKVRFARWRLSHQPALAGIKHLNRLDNVMARKEWSDPDIFESLMLDQEGYVVEGVMSNLFVIRDNHLWTAELKTCGVAGVMRGKVIEASRRLGLTLQWGHFTSQDILTADGLILTNSLYGLVPVHQCEGRQWKDFSFCTFISQSIFENKRIK